MQINVLGTMYDYVETTSKEDQGLCSNNGYCDIHAKKIVVETDYNENDPQSIKNYDHFKAFIKTHELIHAFFAESGIKEWCDDEKLVTWVAWQLPKILEASYAIGAMKKEESA